MESLIKVNEEFKAEHPDCPTLSLICRLAIGTKNDDKNRNDFVALIQKVRTEKKERVIDDDKYG